MTISNAAFAEGYIDLLVDQGVAFDDVAAAKTDLAALVESWRAGTVTNVDLMARIVRFTGDQRNLIAGEADGGPDSDGYYPIVTDDAGTTVSLPCYRKLASMMVGLQIKGTLASEGDLPGTGSPGDLYVIDGDAWAWIVDTFVNVGPFQGPAGPELELRVNGGYIQWRVVGDVSWTNLIATSSLVGATGATLELRTDSGKIQWRPVTGGSWTDLVTLAAITGPKGDKGDAYTPDAIGVFADRDDYDAEAADFGFLATDEGNIYFRLGATAGVWSTGVPFGRGEAGLSAYEIAVENGYAYDEATWLASLHGADGADGSDGADFDPAQLEGLRQDTGRLLLRQALVSGTAIALVAGMVDHFSDTNQVDLTASANEVFYAVSTYFSNTTPTPSQIPTFSAGSPTSATSGGYTVTASSVAASNPSNLYDVWKAFDGNNATYWIGKQPGQSVTTPITLKVQLPSAEHASAYAIRSYPGDNTAGQPNDWLFQGSNDGSSWTTLDTRTGVSWTAGQERSYSLSGGVAYAYYRLSVSAYGGDALAISGLTVTLVGGASEMSLISKAYTAAAEPEWVNLTVLARASTGSLIIGTDLTGFVSRDDGETWTEAVLEAQETNDGWTTYQAFNVDVSGQPAGTDMRWKLDTSDDKDVRIDGVWISWQQDVPNPEAYAGPTGAAGADGRTVLSGSGAPSGGTGANGDFYIRTSDWTIYGPKAGGSWGSPTSLVGATGSTGATGATGAAGTDGNDGWSPVFSVENDGARRVLKVIDWAGGEGTKPAINKYLGATGLETLIANGVDIRGAAGSTPSGRYETIAFFDDFSGKADTSNGTLGTPLAGGSYDIRGAGGTSASIGRISDGKLITDEGNTLYAVQTLRGQCNRIGCQGGFSIGTGSGESGIALLVGPDNAGAALYTNNAVHVVVTRTTWIIQYILAGAFVTVKTGTFPSALSLDTAYNFEVWVDGGYLYYSFAGVNGRVFSTGFKNARLGPYATFEHYYQSNLTRADKPYFTKIWAGQAPVGRNSLREKAMAYWRFESNAWRDATGNGHTLTGVNTPTTTTGKLGNGVSLVKASSQYLTHADHADFDLNDKDWTITGWIKPAAIESGKYHFIAAKALEWAVYLDGTTGKILAYASTDTTFAGALQLASTGTATVGAWSHFSIRYDSLAGILYVSIDGGAETSTFLTGVGGGSGSLEFGRSSGFNSLGISMANTYFDGVIDELALFATQPGHGGSLSAEERAWIYGGADGLAWPL